MLNDGAACPLCGLRDWIDGPKIDVPALRAYWQTFDVDLDSDFPDLPSHLGQRHCQHCGLHWFVPSPVGGAAFYERLGAWAPYYRSWAWEWDIAIDVLETHRVTDVLEIGAGCGDFLDRVRRRIPDCAGIEFNPKAVATSRSRGFDVTDIALVDVAGGRSAIVAFQVLEHIEKPAAFIAECVAKLRPGGLLIVAIPNQDGFIGSLWNNYLNCPPHHMTLWRKSSLESVAKIFDLEMVDYRAESIKLAQYKMYLLRHRRPTGTAIGKAGNLVCRLLVGVIAPLAFPFVRRGLPGEAHLAAFRKRST
jgi:SAM-dependent methyltransferase